MPPQSPPPSPAAKAVDKSLQRTEMLIYVVGQQVPDSGTGPFTPDWEDPVDFAIKSFEDLPHRLFGINQHMIINYELKEALRIMLRQFNAPIVYCFAYGSGVFPQDSGSRSITEADFRTVHPRPPDALDMDPRKRGNMVRRLPEHFRSRLYFRYRKKLAIPDDDFRRIMDEAGSEDGVRRRQAAPFERSIAADDAQQLKHIVRQVIKQTVSWPSTAQSAKGLLMGGWRRSMRYLGDKFAKWRKGRSRQGGGRP
ncbi:MMP37-like protein [Ophiocordyceps sinensis CO18]|uniref:Phosphatidate cytidylyltransferase, mitochondrial n=1 Tax=Ophiocordyceps sinensis (strain Co18 / CGMCC 3.14243) TaxID=911162 RepID=T5APS7_OPHSC|nr:MMP37-like protein [Ophiocordyceps sinensis CO18]